MSGGKMSVGGICNERLRFLHDVLQGRQVVQNIAGFQGIDEAGDITTLGRGGSDTSAVAMAAALK